MFLEEFQHNSQRISGGPIWLWEKVISMQNLCRARLSTAIWIQFNEGPVEDEKNGGPVIEGHLKAKVITKIWMDRSPCWSVLDFWKMQAKNPVCWTWFFKNQVQINRRNGPRSPVFHRHCRWLNQSACSINFFPEKEKKFFRRQAWQVKVRSYPKITLSCAFYLSPQVCKAFVKFRNFFLVSFFPPLSIEWQKLKNQTKNLSS